jgi:hypothetical protein
MTVAFVTLPDSSHALGLIGNYLGVRAPFRDYEFGAMIATLRYQLAQDAHIVLEADGQIVGYAGWIRTTNEIAQAWVTHDAPLRASFDRVDAVALTVVASDDPKHHLPLIRRFKALNPNCHAYWKREAGADRPGSRRAILKKR